MFALKVRPVRPVKSSRLIKAVAANSSRGFQSASRACYSYSAQPHKKRERMRRDLNFAFVGGLLLATGYVSITHNSLRSDSSLSKELEKSTPPSPQSRSFSTASTTNSVASGPGSAKQPLPVFDDDEVNKRLHQYEESYLVHRGKGVGRYDICQLPSNNPIEDDRSEKIVQVPLVDQHHNNETAEADWYFWSLFDGHSGWTTSAKLRDELVDTVIDQLASSAYKAASQNPGLRLVPTSDAVDRAIKAGFVKLDKEIVTTNIQKLLEHPENNHAAAELLMPALSGSCALMSFYDSHSKRLKVAVTGDSRALLGSVNENGDWTVNSLSADQTAGSPPEVARLLSAHPNEPNVIRNGRVLGSLEPSRAFGDARYKWSKDLQRRIYNQFFGRQSPANLQTPPYVTAEPVVTSHDVSTSSHDFLVMASDGLYEMLSNEEIAGLVVRWMEHQQMIQPKKSFLDRMIPRPKDTHLPPVEDISDNLVKNSQKPPFRGRGRTAPSKYLMEDDNVATHLIRNALSNGGNKESVNLLVSIPSPLSRRYRDDLTVTVVFFQDEAVAEGTPALEVNKAATRGGLDAELKPKL